MNGSEETHAIGGVYAIDAYLAHGEEDVMRGFEEVSVYGRAVCHKLVAGVAVLVYNLHLLHDRRLARLARAWWTRLARCRADGERRKKSGGWTGRQVAGSSGMSLITRACHSEGGSNRDDLCARTQPP